MKLTPAYGRDYKSQKEVQAAFDANKDFMITDFFHPSDGRYINRPQLIEEGYKEVFIRFNRLTKVAKIKVK